MKMSTNIRIFSSFVVSGPGMGVSGKEKREDLAMMITENL